MEACGLSSVIKVSLGSGRTPCGICFCASSPQPHYLCHADYRNRAFEGLADKLLRGLSSTTDVSERRVGDNQDWTSTGSVYHADDGGNACQAVSVSGHYFLPSPGDGERPQVMIGAQFGVMYPNLHLRTTGMYLCCPALPSRQA